MAKNNKTRFFYVLYCDKTWVFDPSVRALGPIYIIISNRGDEREKMSVLSVIRCNHGILGAYPIHGSFNRDNFNYDVTQYFLRLIERDSFLVMDNASIHNERELRNILASKNITLVKLRPYS